MCIRPLAFAAFSMVLVSALETPSGFSHSTCSPFLNAARLIGACAASLVTMLHASSGVLSSNSCGSVYHAGILWRSAKAYADSGTMSQHAAR